MKRSSPLETLKGLRERTREGESVRLAGQLEAKQRAELEERLARERLLDHSSAGQLARRSEHQRLEQGGITAAEGQQRLAWEQAERRRLEQLSADLQRAAAQRRRAEQEGEQARRALERAHAELQQVERRLEQRQHEARQRAEQAQQEAVDEASARRFTQRRDR